jgi:hypothetical protein
MILELIVGFGVLGGAIWVGAALLRRLADFDPLSAVVVSTVTVPALLFGAFYVWTCLFSPHCVF